jgi:hypothetical protein
MPARARRQPDVLDILLIDVLWGLHYSKTAEAALRVFEEPATQAFPPIFVMPGEWRSELETMAAELEFPIKASGAIEQRFREIIQELDRAVAG